MLFRSHQFIVDYIQQFQWEKVFLVGENFNKTSTEFVKFFAASASERYAVGDTVDLIRRDGGTMRVTVVAKIASNQYLSSDLILDYDDNADLVAQDTVFRCFATAGRDDLRAALEAEGIGSATVMSRQGWVDEGIRGAISVPTVVEPASRQGSTARHAAFSISAIIAGVA